MSLPSRPGNRLKTAVALVSSGQAAVPLGEPLSAEPCRGVQNVFPGRFQGLTGQECREGEVRHLLEGLHEGEGLAAGDARTGPRPHGRSVPAVLLASPPDRGPFSGEGNR